MLFCFRLWHIEVSVLGGIDLTDLREFLPCETPEAWIKEALSNIDVLLINHAYLEKCAARSALNMMFRYPDKPELQYKMSRLAREELVHYEQVIKLLKKSGLSYRAMKPSRYAGLLNADVAKTDPQRLTDTLIVGAFIEARSCERFAAIAPHLEEEHGKFYVSLLKSEARHFKDYLNLAELYATDSIVDRISHFREIEMNAILSEDDVFRFHSGVPVNSALSASAGSH